jgi:succinate dehydrogenase / fumarate reductase, flavoprotein subunit
LEGGNEKTFQLHGELARVMSKYVGIFRNLSDAGAALNEIEKLQGRYRNVGTSSTSKHMNYELMNAIELEYMFDVALSIARGALLREESRGAHSRTDFPKRDDEKWLKHSIARISGDGRPDISLRDVTITRYKPMERTY